MASINYKVFKNGSMFVSKEDALHEVIVKSVCVGFNESHEAKWYSYTCEGANGDIFVVEGNEFYNSDGTKANQENTYVYIKEKMYYIKDNVLMSFETQKVPFEVRYDVLNGVKRNEQITFLCAPSHRLYDNETDAYAMEGIKVKDLDGNISEKYGFCKKMALTEEQESVVKQIELLIGKAKDLGVMFLSYYGVIECFNSNIDGVTVRQEYYDDIQEDPMFDKNNFINASLRKYGVFRKIANADVVDDDYRGLYFAEKVK